MITINKENLDETRIERLNIDKEDWALDDILGSDPTPDTENSKDATQRVFVDESISQMPPIRRTPPAKAPRPSAAPAQRRSAEAPQQRKASPAPRRTNSAAKKKQEKVTIIVLCVLAAVLLLSIVGILIATLSPSTDDGKIKNKVFAAGVDLSGMTVEQAKAALQTATGDTYSQLDMTVQVLDTIVTLSPTETGARLDIDAVVKAAYEYGRSIPKNGGNAVYTMDILPYLSLDTGYIEDAVEKLGKQYSTTLSKTTYHVDGSQPAMNPDPATVDTSIVYQTLTINMGTAEYGLNTDRLYEQIMDAYNINLFQVTGECSVLPPDPLDWEAIFTELCAKPQDATIDPNTYLITPEVYGYGFTMSELNAKLAEAAYGEKITIPMRYIEPDITTALLSSGLFQDVLSSFQTNVTADANWNANVKLICDLLNGTIIKAGDTFSFNNFLGEPTTKRGFVAANTYIGKSLSSVIGGGMSQVASGLYNCALIADLTIVERNTHTYAPSFIDAGRDAQVYYGNLDLRFTNNTDQPIRIDATVANGAVQISFVGTNNKNYYVEVSTKVTETREPSADYITMPTDPLGMYGDGDVLTTGIIGYTVNTYRHTYDNIGGRLLSEDLIAETTYAKRNALVIKVAPEDVPDVSEPTDPDTTEPDTTEPDTTEPDTTEPNTTEPNTTEPNTTEPNTTEPNTTEPND